jgi:hypothetical protein
VINIALATVGLQDFDKSFRMADVLGPPKVKAKQIPDNFHDWIKSQTFAICAKMALPLQLPLNSKRPVRLEMYWIGRKMKGFRPFLASTFTGSLKLRQNVEGSNSKSDGKKRKTIPLGFWLVCALTD